MFFWGLLGAGGGVSPAQLAAPSFIFEAGMKAAKPIADFDTWFQCRAVDVLGGTSGRPHLPPLGSS